MLKLLINELEKWAACDAIAEFWWRDDDAQQTTPQLAKLFALSERYKAPLALATIPENLQDNLVTSLYNRKLIRVLQHGYSHRNFAPPEQRKMELGIHRPIEEILAQLKTGFDCLSNRFGSQFVPVLVPPWNRIDVKVVAGLSAIGLKGLSDLGPRPAVTTMHALTQVNVHVDIIDWKNNRCFIGNKQAIAQIISHLAAKRIGQADSTEATGIMTHHLVHDSACWNFLDLLLKMLTQQKNVKILSSDMLFIKSER